MEGSGNQSDEASFDLAAHNAEHGYPEGSQPSVPGPDGPSRADRDTGIYAYGGKPGAKAAPWLVKAQIKAMEQSDLEYKKGK